MLLEDIHHDRAAGLVGPDGHERAPAPHALAVGMGVRLAHSRAGQAAREATSGGSHAGPGQGRHQPAGGHHGADAGNGNHAETRQQARCTADNGAERCARADAILRLLFRIGTHMVAAASDQTGMPVTLVVADDADIAVRDSASLKLCHGIARVFVAIEESGNGLLSHNVSP